MSWLKHAFHVDPPGPAEPTAEQKEVVDWVCRQVVKRHLTTPALAALEMSRPLNFIGSQTMRFFQPFVSAILSNHGHAGYRNFAVFLEQRGCVDYLCQRIEDLEAEYETKERKMKSQGQDDAANHSPTESKETDEAD